MIYTVSRIEECLVVTGAIPALEFQSLNSLWQVEFRDGCAAAPDIAKQLGAILVYGKLQNLDMLRVKMGLEVRHNETSDPNGGQGSPMPDEENQLCEESAETPR